MIGDGVCDELTNIARCLYDGGDCCKPDKSTPLCQVCTCRKTVVKEELIEDMLELDTEIFTYDQDVFGNDITSGATIEIEDVAEEDVCSIVCLENSEEIEINAWMFDINTKQCFCTWMDLSLCDPEKKKVSFTSYLEYKQNVVDLKETVVYIQRAKSINCGK